MFTRADVNGSSAKPTDRWSVEGGPAQEGTDRRSAEGGPAQEGTDRRSAEEEPAQEGSGSRRSGPVWRTPRTEEPGGLQSTWSQRVGHNSAGHKQQRNAAHLSGTSDSSKQSSLCRSAVLS